MTYNRRDRDSHGNNNSSLVRSELAESFTKIKKSVISFLLRIQCYPGSFNSLKTTLIFMVPVNNSGITRRFGIKCGNEH